jgi:hypothetical protein
MIPRDDVEVGALVLAAHADEHVPGVGSVGRRLVLRVEQPTLRGGRGRLRLDADEHSGGDVLREHVRAGRVLDRDRREPATLRELRSDVVLARGAD